jgi:hypothetical protein
VKWLIADEELAEDDRATLAQRVNECYPKPEGLKSISTSVNEHLSAMIPAKIVSLVGKLQACYVWRMQLESIPLLELSVLSQTKKDAPTEEMWAHESLLNFRLRMTGRFSQGAISCEQPVFENTVAFHWSVR